MLLKPVVSVLVANVVSGCSVDVLLGACVLKRLTVVAPDVVVVLEVVVTRGVVVVVVLVVVLAVVLVVVVGVVVVGAIVVVVLRRTAQDKQDNSHDAVLFCSYPSIKSTSMQTHFYSRIT